MKPFGGDLGGKMTLGGKPPAFPEPKKKKKAKPVKEPSEKGW